jgi:DNA-binding MarR family transcriptional regulator
MHPSAMTRRLDSGSAGPPGVRSDLRQKRPFRSAAQEATLALLKTAAVVDRSLNRVLTPSGLSHEQYNVLRILRGAGAAGLPTLEIRRRMVAEGAAITRLLDKLERGGLVTRERPAPNRRQVLCALTPAGAALLGTLEDPINSTDEAAMRSLSVAEQRTLTKLLDRVRADVRADVRANAPEGSAPDAR